MKKECWNFNFINMHWYKILSVFIALMFISCEENFIKTPEAPKGMIYVPAGVLDSKKQRTKRVQTHKIKAFFMDISEVTVRDFKEFIKATNYKTDAERIGNSLILKNTRWQIVDHAYWDNPLGDGKRALNEHPVTHVSYNDIQAYCRWKNRRLPTKEEWEHAARDGINSKKIYPWGDEAAGIGKQKSNIWQGVFPLRNEVLDGFYYTAPVKSFSPTGLGFFDLGGNVWEWVDTEYIEDFGQEAEKQFVIKGGSFLCHSDVCHGYKIDEIQFTSQTNSAFHLGFRTLKDIEE